MTLGASSASTVGNGVATVIAPSKPGQLSAQRLGAGAGALVPGDGAGAVIGRRMRALCWPALGRGASRTRVTRRPAPRRLLLLGLLALPLAGCGLGAGAAPGSVAVTVTDEFGQRELPSPASLKVVGQETVMSLLERNYKVSTHFGGKFVQSINGLSGESEGAEPVDWFYYVNGVEAPKGAAATNVHAGDQIWWDRHDWSQTESVPAVVGSFPEPFLHGIDGVRYPVRVQCSSVYERRLPDGRRAGCAKPACRPRWRPPAAVASPTRCRCSSVPSARSPVVTPRREHPAGTREPAACTRPSPPTARA